MEALLALVVALGAIRGIQEKKKKTSREEQAKKLALWKQRQKE